MDEVRRKARRRQVKASLDPRDARGLLFVRTLADLCRLVAEFRKASRLIGLVPTMGALYEDRVSLVKGALDRGDVPVTGAGITEGLCGPLIRPLQFLPQNVKVIGAGDNRLCGAVGRHSGARREFP